MAPRLLILREKTKLHFAFAGRAMSHCACTGRKAFLPAGITRRRRGREGRTNASSTALRSRKAAKKEERERERERERGRAAAESDQKQQSAIGKGNHWYQPCIASAVRDFPLPLSRSLESASPMTAGGGSPVPPLPPLSDRGYCFRRALSNH